MKKTKSSDKSIHDKQYDAMLLNIKLLVSVLSELKTLTSEMQQYNLFLKDLLASLTLENETV